MSNGYQLGTAQIFKDVAETGIEVPSPTRKLGFETPDDRTRVAYNPDEGKLYLFIVDKSATNLHIYRAVDALDNRWHCVAGNDTHTENTQSQGSYSVASGSLKFPLVTAQNTLLLPFTDTGNVYRLPDWGDSSPTNVHSGEAPLYWRHAIDANGDIYFGDYSGSSGAILRSTDDGQTWTQVTTLSVPNHVHGVGVMPHQDIMAVADGDGSTAGLHFLQKDGSNVNSVNALGSEGDQGTQWVPVMPLGKSQDDNTQENGLWIFGSDSGGYQLLRTDHHIKSDGTHGTHIPDYAVPRTDPNRGRSYVAEIQRVAGAIVAVSQQGKLLVSPDGWWWDEVEIPFTADPRFPQNMTQTPAHLVIASTHGLTVVPKSVVASVNPQDTTYRVVGGSQSTSTTSKATLMQHVDLSKASSIGAIGYANTNWSVKVQEEAIESNNAQVETDIIADTTAGTAARGSVDLDASFGTVLAYGMDSGLEFDVTLRK